MRWKICRPLKDTPEERRRRREDTEQEDTIVVATYAPPSNSRPKKSTTREDSAKAVQRNGRQHNSNVAQGQQSAHRDPEEEGENVSGVKGPERRLRGTKRRRTTYAANGSTLKQRGMGRQGPSEGPDIAEHERYVTCKRNLLARIASTLNTVADRVEAERERGSRARDSFDEEWQPPNFPSLWSDLHDSPSQVNEQARSPAPERANPGPMGQASICAQQLLTPQETESLKRPFERDDPFEGPNLLSSSETSFHAHTIVSDAGTALAPSRQLTPEEILEDFPTRSSDKARRQGSVESLAIEIPSDHSSDISTDLSREASVVPVLENRERSHTLGSDQPVFDDVDELHCRNNNSTGAAHLCPSGSINTIGQDAQQEISSFTESQQNTLHTGSSIPIQDPIYPDMRPIESLINNASTAIPESTGDPLPEPAFVRSGSMNNVSIPTTSIGNTVSHRVSNGWMAENIAGPSRSATSRTLLNGSEARSAGFPDLPPYPLNPCAIEETRASSDCYQTPSSYPEIEQSHPTTMQQPQHTAQPQQATIPRGRGKQRAAPQNVGVIATQHWQPWINTPDWAVSQSWTLMYQGRPLERWDQTRFYDSYPGPAAASHTQHVQGPRGYDQEQRSGGQQPASQACCPLPHYGSEPCSLALPKATSAPSWAWSTQSTLPQAPQAFNHYGNPAPPAQHRSLPAATSGSSVPSAVPANFKNVTNLVWGSTPRPAYYDGPVIEEDGSWEPTARNIQFMRTNNMSRTLPPISIDDSLAIQITNPG